MLSYLAEFEDVWGPFRLFDYISFRALMAGGTAIFIGMLIAPYLFARLRLLNASQSFRDKSEVGHLAELHSAKHNTPTMGGLVIFISLVISTLLWAKPNVFVLGALFVYTCMTVVGFVDDYLKVTKKNSKGISSKWKLLGQGIAVIGLIGIISFDQELLARMRELWVPFVKSPIFLNMPIVVVFLFLFVVLAGSSNAINLTDGVDGLAIGCTVSVALAYMIMSYAAGNAVISEYLFISFLPGSGELAIVCCVLLGASLVFLWYNSHPAEVFMGDTGSLALGGLLGAIAFMIHQPFTLVIVGGIFVIEALSVILQVGSFKLRGKRIFKMAPIHHHFELKGWHESKVVIRFWIVSLLFAMAGLATLKLR